MKRTLFLVAAIFLVGITVSGIVFAENQVLPYPAEKIVDAIYLAEGAEKAQFLYGIRSVSYDTPLEARRICLRSVENNIKRWEKAGNPGEFISFMQKRYCPVNAKNDPKGLNNHWIKNVMYFLNKK